MAVGLLLLPSVLTWPVSLKAQKMFIDAKIAAGYPLIPQLPYVVYPDRQVMDAIFWLRDNTDHEAVVLTAETLGSMLPAYSGNTVYLGHGNQTVYFEQKMALMKRFYQGLMTRQEMKDFLQSNRLTYVFYGPEERQIGKLLPVDFLAPVFQNDQTTIYQVLLPALK